MITERRTRSVRELLTTGEQAKCPFTRLMPRLVGALYSRRPFSACLARRLAGRARPSCQQRRRRLATTRGPPSRFNDAIFAGATSSH